MLNRRNRVHSRYILSMGILCVFLIGATGCWRRPPAPAVPTPPPPGSGDSAPEQPSWKVLQPGLKLVYKDEKTGEQSSSEQCAPTTLGGQKVIPVVGDDEEFVQYVAEQNGWLVEVGVKDPNGRAAWSKPIRLYPLDPTAGTQWEEEEQGGITKYEVEAIEEIDTPAGHFRAARVQVKILDSTTEEEQSAYRFWYDLASGLVVKAGDMVLIKQEEVKPRPDPGRPAE